MSVAEKGFRVRVVIETTSQLLGTQPSDQETFVVGVAGRVMALDPDDPGRPSIADLEADMRHLPPPPVGDDGEPEAEPIRTGFYRDDKARLCLRDYQIKGFLKEACSSKRVDAGAASAKLAAHRKWIDRLVFVWPEYIPLDYAPDRGPTDYGRPMRGQTARGERIAIATSERLLPPVRATFEVEVLPGPVSRAMLDEWLAYGRYQGLLQWRSGGNGRFRVVSIEPVEAEAIEA